MGATVVGGAVGGNVELGRSGAGEAVIHENSDIPTGEEANRSLPVRRICCLLTIAFSLRAVVNLVPRRSAGEISVVLNLCLWDKH